MTRPDSSATSGSCSDDTLFNSSLPIPAFSESPTAAVPKELKKVEPVVFFTQSITNDAAKLAEEGYMLVGFADYWTSNQPDVLDLKKKAKQVGATVVVCQINYRETVTQYRPMFNWVPGTRATYNSSGFVTTQSSASAYGAGWGGFGTAQSQGYYNSSGAVSSPGYAQYAGSMPYNVRLYDIGAIFCREPNPRTQ